MLVGMKCLTSDQLVISYLNQWKQMTGGAGNILQLNLPLNDTEWISRLYRTTRNLNKSLERRRMHCYKLGPSKFKLKLSKIEPNINEEDLDSGLEEESQSQMSPNMMRSADLMRSAETMRQIELATMASNIFATLIVLFLALFQLEYPRLHIPWLVLTAIEIVGNLCVAVAFSIVPGYCLLTSLVCILRVFYLTSIWAKAIRRSMMNGLTKASGGRDLEQQSLRDQLVYKGKPGFARILGSYS